MPEKIGQPNSIDFVVLGKCGAKLSIARLATQDREILRQGYTPIYVTNATIRGYHFISFGLLCRLSHSLLDMRTLGGRSEKCGESKQKGARLSEEVEIFPPPTKKLISSHSSLMLASFNIYCSFWDYFVYRLL